MDMASDVLVNEFKDMDVWDTIFSKYLALKTCFLFLLQH